VAQTGWLHRTRRGGGLGHVDEERSYLNKRLLGAETWAADRRAKIRDMALGNYDAELASLTKRGRKACLKRRIAEGPKQPWRPSRSGPLREAILTVNRKWFGDDLEGYVLDQPNRREAQVEGRTIKVETREATVEAREARVTARASGTADREAQVAAREGKARNREERAKRLENEAETIIGVAEAIASGEIEIVDPPEDARPEAKHVPSKALSGQAVGALKAKSPTGFARAAGVFAAAWAKLRARGRKRAEDALAIDREQIAAADEAIGCRRRSGRSSASCAGRSGRGWTPWIDAPPRERRSRRPSRSDGQSPLGDD
jgi:hypothetical protein